MASRESRIINRAPIYRGLDSTRCLPFFAIVTDREIADFAETSGGFKVVTPIFASEFVQ